MDGWVANSTPLVIIVVSLPCTVYSLGNAKKQTDLRKFQANKEGASTKRSCHPYPCAFVLYSFASWVEIFNNDFKKQPRITTNKC